VPVQIEWPTSRCCVILGFFFLVSLAGAGYPSRRRCGRSRRRSAFQKEAPDQHIETPISAIEYVAGSAVFKGGTMEAYRTNIAAIRDAAALARGDAI
jgi:hypothetical protein